MVPGADRGSAPYPYIRPYFWCAWRGANGTMRERSPGVWEIRVAVGVDPVSGRTVQRSFAFHGCAEDAELRRKELAAEWAERRADPPGRPVPHRRRTARALAQCAPRLAAGDVDRGALQRQGLGADPLAVRRVSTLKPEHVRAAMAAWSSAGASVAVVSGRFRVLRSAIGWAHVERVIDVNPLSGMRGPQRPGTRLHLSTRRGAPSARRPPTRSSPALSREDAERRHKAEQIRLLVRLAADSGARRGELVALRFDDLDGRVLTIERGVSADVLGPTKTGRTRRLTLGRQTVELWRSSAQTWAGSASRAAPPSAHGCSPPRAPTTPRLTAGALGHWFAELARRAEVPGATLHRLRHSVATFLVGRGELLRAQQRLGHRDPSTTLRNYAHALPLEDETVADDIDEMLGAAWKFGGPG